MFGKKQPLHFIFARLCRARIWRGCSYCAVLSARFCPVRICYCALLSARFCLRGFVQRAFVTAPYYTADKQW